MTAAEIQAERAAVVAEARTWLMTPFHHGARVKGAGVDCSQLLIAVFCDALRLVPPIEPGYYPPDWFLHKDYERIALWMPAYCHRTAAPAPGDIALFRFGRAASHAGIVVTGLPEPTALHSFAGAGVTVSELQPGHALHARLDSVWSLKRWAEA